MHGRDEGRRSTDWHGLAVFAGGAAHLDAALQGAVIPAVGDARDSKALRHWFFTRWSDERGPQLRLALAGPDVGGVRDAVARRLEDALGGDIAPRDPVLPPPTSQRRSGRPPGVETVEHRTELRRFGAGLERAEAFFEISSEIVVDALPRLPKGRERVAYGLALMEVLCELGVEARERTVFWQEVAMRWTGSDEVGRVVLDRVAAQARRLGPQIAHEARCLREHGDSGLGRYEQACEAMLAGAPQASRADLVGHHAHLTNNRLGVNPFEELLLACVLSTAPPVGRSELLALEQVTKQVGDGTVLDGVSLTVREGEVFGVVGPEGAGKSSLLGVLSGLQLTQKGSVRVMGVDPGSSRVSLADDLGLVLPDEELASPSSVRENLELRSRAGGPAADAVAATVGLSDHMATAVEHLNRGERRRVAIGCALMRRPRLLVLDEPTVDLSAVEREAVWRVVQTVRDGGATVVLATTSVQEMRGVCDRAALMLAGTIVDVGEPEELAEHHFSPRSVHFATIDEPDAALLQDLPEVLSLRIEERADHWMLEVGSRQPDELLRVIGNDPDFPHVTFVALDDLEATFLTHAGAAGQER